MVNDVRPDVRKRPICAHCFRPSRGCICSLVTPVDNRVELLLLQDKSEAANAKNTGSLLHRSLQNSALFTLDADQSADAAALEGALYGDGKFPLLLYPPTSDATALGLAAPVELPSLDGFDVYRLRLIVIDATWRKSRKILYLNDALQKLPRLTLENPPKSLYSIRKSDRQNQLSTLEASCYALRRLEQDSVDYSPLLAAMKNFVSLQAGFIPPRIECR